MKKELLYRLIRTLEQRVTNKVNRRNFILEEYKRKDLLSKSTTTEELADFLDEYNWDDGFEVPEAIDLHKNCDLGLALNFFICLKVYFRSLRALMIKNMIIGNALLKCFMIELYIKNILKILQDLF